MFNMARRHCTTLEPCLARPHIPNHQGSGQLEARRFEEPSFASSQLLYKVPEKGMLDRRPGKTATDLIRGHHVRTDMKAGTLRRKRILLPDLPTDASA